MQRNKRLLTLICFLLHFCLPTQAQYGNEWINFNQTYYKIQVTEEGLYELSFDALVAAQINLNTIDARTFKLYHRGEEVALNIPGQSDGRLTTGEFIQFLAKPNDGQSDTPLYVEPSLQPHTFYNLFSDAAAYFLTWSVDGSFGKRMARANPISNISGIAARTSTVKTIRNLFTQSGTFGRAYQPDDAIYKTAFDLGEAWTGIRFAGEETFVMSGINEQLRSDNNLTIEILIQGRNNRPHEVEVLVGPDATSLRSLGNLSFQNFDFRRLNETLNWSDINTNGDLYVVVRTTASAIDRVSVSYVALNYNRSFDLSGTTDLSFRLPAQASNNSFLTFDNAASTATLFRIDDFNDPQLLETNRVGSTINTVVQNTAAAGLFYVQNAAPLNAVLNRVSFRNFNGVDPDYVIISNKLLNTPSENYAQPVTAYSNYRASTAGGSYDTLTVFMDQLHNQFNYGEPSPMNIFRFSQYLVENTKAEYVFLIGKGLNWYHRPYRKARNQPNLYDEFVPSAGYPGADNFYGFNIEAPNTFSLSFGRLNAHNPEVVDDYLQKIIETEANPIDDLRRKAFLHLSGGLSEAEINVFRGFIEDFSADAVSPFIGGSAEEITKQSTQVVENINVSEQVNQGVHMITFFGHSETSSSDIDIGFVTNTDLGYQNEGKYPLIFINGCNAGAIYEESFNALTFGENWVNTPDLGAMHVMAHTALGIPNELKRYSDFFYDKAFGDSTLIDQPIGKIHLETSNAYLRFFGENPTELFLSQAQQFNLMGDPAYRLFPASTPDFAISDSDISLASLNGLPVDALTTEFALDLIVKNYGITTSDSLGVIINRRLEDNALVPLDTQFYAAPLNTDTLRFFITNTSIGAFGQSTFEVTLDPLDSIPELSEFNNEASFDFFFNLGTTLNLYPYPFSVAPEADIKLVTQSIDLLSDERQFLFELDTVDGFYSPFLKRQTVTGKVIAEWQPDLTGFTNQTFYWRSKFAQIEAGEVDQWSNSSFTLIADSPQGWVQNDLAQFQKNEVEGLSLTTDDWNFLEETIELAVVSPAEDGPERMSIEINGEEYSPYGFAIDECDPNSLNLVAFDQSTGQPYRILTNGGFDRLDPFSCGRSPQVINTIRNSQLNDPTTYFKRYYDELPEGDYVLMLSFNNVAWSILRANNRAEIIDLGASAANFDALQNGNPYILFGQKGAGEGQGIEEFSLQQPDDDLVNQLVVNLDQTIDIAFNSGSVTSTTIGPARSWQSVDAVFADVEANDEVRIDVFGLDSLNNQTLLLSDVSLPADISNIDAAVYERLRLRTILTDTADFTAPRLQQWKAAFEELPDAVLILNQERPAALLKLPEGEEVELKFSAVNVTPNNFTDSIHSRVTTFNRSTRITRAEPFKIPAIPADSAINFISTVNTRGNVGLNSLSILLNESAKSEFRSINNQISFNGLLDIKRDSLPPFIDVTFDGINILDGDIVSPSPVIKLTLKDENSVIQRTDTTGITLSLQALCDGCQSRPIYFSNPRVSFEPSVDDKPFSITYRPESFEDGNYTLRANATDASGNSAGEEPFQVTFEVINASTITNFYPYPNPFSTQTRFVFTLTGNEIPNEIKIQILTVTGRVVREILQDEIGMIHIGNNITEYAWDGRDEFGDRLANGVYLYRVLVRNNGSFMEQRATSADKAFKKGYGKLYILR